MNNQDTFSFMIVRPLLVSFRIAVRNRFRLGIIGLATVLFSVSTEAITGGANETAKDVTSEKRDIQNRPSRLASELIAMNGMPFDHRGAYDFRIPPRAIFVPWCRYPQGLPTRFRKHILANCVCCRYPNGSVSQNPIPEHQCKLSSDRVTGARNDALEPPVWPCPR